MKRFCLIIAMCVGVVTPASAQDSVSPGNDIVVTGEREREAKDRVEQMTRAITRKPRIANPIARQYGRICVGVIGLADAHAAVLIDRMEADARRLDIAVAPQGCQVNTLVAFVRDGRAEVAKLREQAPWLFTDLQDYEYDRILTGDGGARAWHTTEKKEVDGKSFRKVIIPCLPMCPEREVLVSDPFNATRIAQQVRVDMVGSVVLMDSALVPGKTLQQLADYAAIRSFASVDDMAEGGPDATPTILSLFADGETAPPEMTEFDWAYLEALYKLPRTATGSAIHDAAWSEYRKKVIRNPN